MKKALMIASILVVAVISTACINNIAVQELNNKANEYMQKGDYESAMNRLQASLDLDSTMYQTYYNLGVAAINAKKYETAIDALEKGIVIKPDFYDFYYSLGVAQIALADELLEQNEVVEEENNGKEGLQPLDIERTKELKSSAIGNLLKYLDNVPNPKDKETVQEMLKECEDYINPSKEESPKA